MESKGTGKKKNKYISHTGTNFLWWIWSLGIPKRTNKLNLKNNKTKVSDKGRGYRRKSPKERQVCDRIH